MAPPHIPVWGFVCLHKELEMMVNRLIGMRQVSHVTFNEVGVVVHLTGGYRFRGGRSAATFNGYTWPEIRDVVGRTRNNRKGMVW